MRIQSNTDHIIKGDETVAAKFGSAMVADVWNRISDRMTKTETS